jgi:hypothetical protein
MGHGAGNGAPDLLGWADELRARWEALAEELRRRLGPGVPLEPVVRRAFEARLGGDLGGARLHASALPGRLAAALGAEALAVGGHVLGERLEAGTVQGAALLGHELTHVAEGDGRPPSATQAGLPAGEGTGAAPDGEAAAQSVERALLQEGQSSGTASDRPRRAVDVEALAERVYGRLVDTLLLERERGAWLP